MKTINKVALLGVVGQNPEIKYTQGGLVIANFSIATNERFKDKNTGQYNKNTHWHNCASFGKLAEIIEKYVKKGSKVYLDGKLDQQQWIDKETQKKRYKTQITVLELVLLDNKKDKDHYDNNQPNSNENGSFPDEDIPF